MLLWQKIKFKKKNGLKFLSVIASCHHRHNNHFSLLIISKKEKLEFREMNFFFLFRFMSYTLCLCDVMMMMMNTTKKAPDYLIGTQTQQLAIDVSWLVLTQLRKKNNYDYGSNWTSNNSHLWHLLYYEHHMSFFFVVAFGCIIFIWLQKLLITLMVSTKTWNQRCITHHHHNDRSEKIWKKNRKTKN